MTRVLVTGATGMLGSAIIRRWSSPLEVFATGRTALPPGNLGRFRAFDLSRDSCRELVDWAEPSVIVHCAALTLVDRCESEPEYAEIVNGKSVEKLLAAAPHCRLVYISSDAVLGGVQPATEEARPTPKSVYARSKALGERFVRAAGGRHTVVRTTVVGIGPPPVKRGFVSWLVSAVRAKTPITLFADAFFSPIAAIDLADELAWVVTHDTPNILHVSGRETVSKFDFGSALCDSLGLDRSMITKGSIGGANFAAARVADQSLDCRLYERIANRKLPSVAETITHLALELRD